MEMGGKVKEILAHIHIYFHLNGNIGNTDWKSVYYWHQGINVFLWLRWQRRLCDRLTILNRAHYPLFHNP